MTTTHKHLIIRAETDNTPMDEEFVKEWLTTLVEKIGMKLLDILKPNPTVGYCNIVSNRGLTGVALIETSHIVLHAWDEPGPKGGSGICQLDVYTCSEMNPQDVFDHLQIFQPTKISYKYLDRETDLIEIEI